MTRTATRQLRLAGIMPHARDEPHAFARLHKSLGAALCGQLERLRDDYRALGLPPDIAAEHAAAHWTQDQADRLRRYLTGAGPHAGRVTT